ncbi:MAG: LysR family transcriptional regulator [Spirochaetes bacterium]|nr:LysR family transcriptional regulator [Spirochaetota bacterium]
MDLIKVRAFYTVATLSSISEAAKHLHYTQPAISAQIRELEHELQTKLFERAGRSLRLTEAGNAFLPHAERLLQDFDSCKQALNQLTNQGEEPVRIGASLIPGMYILPKLISAYRAVDNGFTFSLDIQNAYDVERMLFDQQIDLGFLGRRKPFPLQNALEATLLFLDHHVLILPPKHPLLEKQQIQLKDLTHVPLILPARNTVTRKSLDTRFRELGFSPQIHFEVNNIEAIKRMVIQGIGASIVCWITVREEVASGLLAACSLSGFEVKRYFYMVQRKSTTPLTLSSFSQFVLTYTRSKEFLH